MMTQAKTLWHLYVIRTKSGSLYTGITTDVVQRLSQHQSGSGAKALRGKGPFQLVLNTPIGKRRLALSLEYRIKQLSKKQKEQLVTTQPPSLEQWLHYLTGK